MGGGPGYTYRREDTAMTRGYLPVPVAHRVWHVLNLELPLSKSRPQLSIITNDIRISNIAQIA